MKRGTIKILLVEDDKIDQMAFKRLMEMESLPYECQIAGSVAESQKKLQEDTFDVVITDYSLGDGTAFDVFELVTDTPIIFVTGGGDEETAVKAMKAGAFDYLIKDPDRNYLKVLPVVVENAIKRKQAEKQAQLLSRAIKSITDSVFITDMQDKIIYVNKAFCDTYGYSEKEIIGKRSSIIWCDKKAYSEAGNNLDDIRQDCMAGEFVNRRKDGRAFQVCISRSVVTDDTGEQIAIIGVARDITERVEAEKALSESEERFRTLFEKSPDAIFVEDFKGNILNANPAACELHGLPAEKLIGMNVVDTVPDENKELVKNQFSQWTSGKLKYFEGLSLTRDGKSVPVEIRANRANYQGKPALIFQTRDITERKHAEETLRASEEKYRLLVENVNDGIVISQNDKFIFFNQQFAQMLGYSAEELFMKDYREVYTSKSLEILYNREARRNHGEQVPSRYETVFRTKDGREIDIEANVTIIDYQGSSATFAVIRDISDRKKAEDQIKASLLEKEVLLKEIHHRVKNNLQIISSLLYLQSKNIKNKEAFNLFMDSQARIKTMALIHEKLYRSEDFANIGFAEYLRSLSDHLIQTYQTGEKRVNLVINVEEVVFTIEKAIPCGLIVNELVSNSLKHAFPNGKEGQIQIDLFKTNGRLDEEGEMQKYTLIVHDSGVGLPKEIDFRQTRSLGLQLVNNLTRQLKGSISLKRNGGTTFKINFDA